MQPHIPTISFSFSLRNKLIISLREKMKASSYVAVFAVVVVLVLAEAKVSMAVTCNPTELAPCASAFTSSSPPSKLCCTKVVEQKPCLCGYIKNPNYRKYLTSPNAQKIAAACGVPIPNC